MAKQPKQPPKRRRASPKIPGWSPNGFAAEVGSSPVVIRSLIKAGQLETIDVAGRPRIPPREKARYLETWGE
jgi:hypothetical protein